MAFVSSLPSSPLPSVSFTQRPQRQPDFRLPEGLQRCRLGLGVNLSQIRDTRLSTESRRISSTKGTWSFVHYAVSHVGNPGATNSSSSSKAMLGSSSSISSSSSSSSSSRRFGNGTIIMPGKKLSWIGILFFIITYLWSFVLFIPMAIMHPIVLIFDGLHRKFHDMISLAWFKLSMLSVKIRPQLIHSENLPSKDQTCIFVANHASVVDIYACGFLERSCKYVAKSDVFHLPVVGWAMAMAGNISFQRKRRRGKMNAYRKMVLLLKNRISLVIFPEGTRSITGRLGKFKKGAFRAAVAAQVPIVPITITGTREMMPSHAYVPLRYPPQPIRLHVHKPIESKGKTDEELSRMAFRAIDSGLPLECQTDLGEKS